MICCYENKQCTRVGEIRPLPASGSSNGQSRVSAQAPCIKIIVETEKKGVGFHEAEESAATEISLILWEVALLLVLWMDSTQLFLCMDKQVVVRRTNDRHEG